jgi:hypothetical protein
MRKPLSPWSTVLFLGFSLAMSTGCATVFRDSKVKVHIESDPGGAQARVSQSETKPTPADMDVERSSTSAVVINKPGYAEHRGLIKKKMNGGWLAADIVSCVWALCIPLLIDAISGAWLDVAPSYSAKLEPATGGTAPAGTAGGPPAVGSATPAPTGSTPDTTSSLSESERKATARAAYIEGVGLQDKNDCAGALPKFEVAQKMFSAPTHLLHIAQCQAAIGKLVEAQETYETLTRATIAPDAPQAFKQAQDEGRKELPALKPRIPTLRVQVAPANAKGMLVLVNGSPMPNELVGIARPVNPGKYKVSAEASGMKAAPQEVDLVEGANKTVDLTLKK